MTAQALPNRGRIALGSIAVAALLYRMLLRRPIRNWGATDAEANARLPGDELLEEATASRPARSRLVLLRPRSGPGSPRWVPPRAAAPTPTTGSRTCSGSTCTAPTA